MILNPTREQVLNDTLPDWSLFCVGLTQEFRVIVYGALTEVRLSGPAVCRCQQLVVTRSPEDGLGATAEWRTLASTTTAREAVDTMHGMQMDFVKRMRERRGA